MGIRTDGLIEVRNTIYELRSKVLVGRDLSPAGTHKTQKHTFKIIQQAVGVPRSLFF